MSTFLKPNQTGRNGGKGSGKTSGSAKSHRNICAEMVSLDSCTCRGTQRVIMPFLAKRSFLPTDAERAASSPRHATRCSQILDLSVAPAGPVRNRTRYSSAPPSVYGLSKASDKESLLAGRAPPVGPLGLRIWQIVLEKAGHTNPAETQDHRTLFWKWWLDGKRRSRVETIFSRLLPADFRSSSPLHFARRLQIE